VLNSLCQDGPVLHNHLHAVVDEVTGLGVQLLRSHHDTGETRQSNLEVVEGLVIHLKEAEGVAQEGLDLRRREVVSIHLHATLLVIVAHVVEVACCLGDEDDVVVSGLVVVLAQQTELDLGVARSRLWERRAAASARGVRACRPSRTSRRLVTPSTGSLGLGLGLGLDLGLSASGLSHQGRHHIHILHLIIVQIGRQPLANGLAAPRRAREVRKVPLQVLHVVHQLAHVIQTRRGPHPAVRHVLKEEPGDSRLLVVEVAQKLLNGRLIRRLWVTCLLQVCHDNLNIDGHVEAVAPLIQNGRPVKDTSRAKARPKERHFIRGGTFGRAGPKNHFFCLGSFL